MHIDLRWLAVATIAGGLSLVGQAAWAVPSLQLGFDPNLNGGEVTTNCTAPEPTSCTSGPEATLTAYALENPEDGDNPFLGGSSTSTTTYLTVALDTTTFPESLDPNGTVNVSVTINGVTTVLGTDIAWEFGTPPSGLIDDLAPHGEFPSWFAEVSFDFDTMVSEITNVQDDPQFANLSSIPDGALAWREDIDIVISGPETLSVHLDLYTMDGEGGVHRFAPFSHDAEVVPGVPEPATMAMFLTGGLIALGAGRKRRRAAAAADQP